MANRDTLGSVDGEAREFVIRLPRKVHLCAIAIVLVFAGIEIGRAFSEEKTGRILASVATTLLGTGGVMLAFYTVFYARQSFLLTRERDRRIRTLEFSRQFSLPPMTQAREAIVARYNKLLDRFERKGTRYADVRAQQKLSKRIGDAFESRGTGQGNGSDEALLGPVILILDYFEDLAVGIKMKTLDEDVARLLLKSTVLNYGNLFKQIIDLERSKKQIETVYEHFEWLRNRWA